MMGTPRKNQTQKKRQSPASKSASAKATLHTPPPAQTRASPKQGTSKASTSRQTNRQTPPVTRSTPKKTPTVSVKPKVKQLLSKKRFYLDLKSRSVSNARIRQLVEDIQYFGGVIDDFFSREITTVISDAPDWKLLNPTGNPDSISPGTPISASAFANSPWSPATPLEGKKIPRSKIETIIERARIQAKGTSDVIENAHKWNIKVYALHKFLNWLDAVKAKIGRPRRIQKPFTRSQTQSAESSLNRTTELKAPYIKFEATNHLYRPVYQEFKKFPTFYLEGKFGTSPFYTPSNPLSAGKKRLLKDDVSNNIIHKDRHSKQAKKLKEGQQMGVTKKEDDFPPPQLNKKAYCEICETTFSDFENHIESAAHKKIVSLPITWAKLDFCIGLVNMNSDDSIPAVTSDF